MIPETDAVDHDENCYPPSLYHPCEWHDLHTKMPFNAMLGTITNCAETRAMNISGMMENLCNTAVPIDPGELLATPNITSRNGGGVIAFSNVVNMEHSGTANVPVDVRDTN